MMISNGKVVPAFQPELIKAALAFLQRAQMSGAEAPTFIASCDLLAAIADGKLTVVPPSVIDDLKASRDAAEARED
jgi:hypothetical protein